MTNLKNNKESLDKEIVLENAEQLQKSVEELQRSADALNACDMIDGNDKDNIARTETVQVAKKIRKQKVQSKNRFLGHHRYYLYSGVKIRHVILFILVILFAILCIGKLMPPKANTSISPIVTNKSDFGEKINVSINNASYTDSNLLLDLTITNNEPSKIEYNPTSFVLSSGSKVYSASIIEDNATEIYANGIESGQKTSFTIKYAIPVDTGILTLSSSFKTNTESCVIKTSVNMGAE